MPGYRGRLIWPFKAEIARLSQDGTDADPDGVGPLTSGYDPIFREPVLLPDAERVGVVNRVELAPILVPCQVESRMWEAIRAMRNGDSPRNELRLVLHFQDLEALGLVDPITGDALIRKGDRLVSIRDFNTEVLVQAVTTPPGLYIQQAEPRSYGLSGLARNLLVLHLSERETGTSSPG